MSRTPANHDLTRRQMLGRSASLLAGLAAGSGVVSVARSEPGATSEVTFQLGWIISNGQNGEIVARSLGYLEAEEINLTGAPGGHSSDAVTGWLTNVSALRALGPDRVDMRLWDAGIQLYANLYYATDETVQKHAEVLAGFTRAAAKGWLYAYQNPEKAVDLLVKAYPNLDRDTELDAIKPVLNFSFTKTTAAKGWGTMEPSVWEQQIHIYEGLAQFKGPAPKATDVMTDSILKMTAAARPKIGA